MKDTGTRSPATPDGEAHDEADADLKSDVNEEHKGKELMYIERICMIIIIAVELTFSPASPDGEVPADGTASTNEMKEEYKGEERNLS